MRPPRKLVVFLGAAAMLGAAGCGAVASGDSANVAANQSQNPYQAQSQGQMPNQGQGGPGGMDLSALASKLGVSESRLQKAMQANRPQSGSNTPPTADSMAASLAQELGLTTAKVKGALKAVMPSGGPPQGTMPQRGSTQPPGGSSSSGTSTGTT